MTIQLKSKRLQLSVPTVEETRLSIADMPDEIRAEVSDEWLSMVQNAAHPNPWIHGFRVQRLQDNQVIGSCGFKGPPDTEGVVELAYGIDEEFRGQGFATEAAEIATSWAINQPEVTVVRAHTLPTENPSTSVLAKCGFRNVGEVQDPDDGRVWRWEITAS